MMSHGYSIPIPTIDNSLRLKQIDDRIALEQRNAERACDFGNSPCAQQDPIIRQSVLNLLIEIEENRYQLGEHYEGLASEHGDLAPTQETWDALTEQERWELILPYVEVECINGAWEFNPWGPLIERNNPGYFPSSPLRITWLPEGCHD